ncbi:MAG: DNA polymerase III subunit gamma/tau [Candidatus Omnitrophota bacterium]
MSYTVFALKWRPNNFDEIVGQNHIVTTLKNAVGNNRLAHAYIFAGPRGVGKTSTARILAKALNCKDGPTLSPCGKCPACVDIAAGRSFDVIEIDGASNRGIDEIRTLRENVKFPPTNGKFKVYIIDEVHMLTTEAFNALLKTLEEPPDFVKFIFATTHAHKVPPTVLSRCQRLDFRRIPVVEIIKQLEQISVKEKIQIDKEALFTIARSSDGALRDAESLLDQLSSFAKGKISLEDVIAVLGIVEQDALFEITNKMMQKDSKGALELFNRVIDEGKDIGVFLSSLIEHFRNLMVAKVSRADVKLIDLPAEICEKLLAQSRILSLEEIFAAFNILVNAQEMAKRLESLRIPLEIALIKLSHDKKAAVVIPAPPVSSKPEYREPPKSPFVKEIKVEKEIKPIAQERKVEPIIAAEDDVNIATTLDAVKSGWQGIIDAVSRVKMSLATYLNEGSPVGLDKNIITVAFPKNYAFHKESLEVKDNRDLIEKILCDSLNANLRLNFILSQEAIHKETDAEHPFIKSAIAAFGGRIIKKE